jgi:uncharacterized membrane protein YdjX (TVP38/TMEM64 family)
MSGQPEKPGNTANSAADADSISMIMRQMLPMILVLAVPIVPFVLFHERIELWAEQVREHPAGKTWVAGLVTTLLASDIFLPIPSSLVCTFAGAELGTWNALLFTWIGMSLGAIFGFALARAFGERFVHWFVRPAEMHKIEAITHRMGPLLLALARGVPVLAEASVLWMGLHGLPWKLFLPPVLLGNLALCVGYCLLGDIAQQHAWLPTALAASTAVPVLLLGLAKVSLRQVRAK